MLAGGIEDLAVESLTFVDDFHLVVDGRNGTVAGFQHLVLQAAGSGLHAWLGLVLCQEALAFLLVGFVAFVDGGKAGIFENFLGCGVGIDAVVFLQGSGKTVEDKVFADGIELVIEIGYHAVFQHVGNLQTGRIGTEGAVVAMTGGFVETAEEIGHLGRGDAELLLQIGEQTIGDGHAGSIAQ